MPALRRGLKVYISAVVLAGGLTVTLALLIAPPRLTAETAILVVLLVSCIALTYLVPLKLASKRRVIFDTSFQTVALLTLPPGQAALVSALGVALGNCYLRRPWFNTIFNTAQVALSVVTAAATYRLIAADSLAGLGRDLRSVLALIPAAVVLHVVSAVAVDGATAIQRRRSPWENWLSVHGPSFAPHAALVVIGAAISTSVGQAPWLILVAIAPVFVIHAGLRRYTRLNDETVQLVEEIADIIDAASHGDIGKSRRVAAVALRLAAACKLPEAERERLYLAALLLDADAALLIASVAPEGNSADHRRRAHWDVASAPGTKSIGAMLRLRGVAEIIAARGERFDGGGQPRGVAGKDIPLESRILALADAWVELTSERDYRPALTPQEALFVLRAGANTQWDPALVDALHDIAHGSAHTPALEPGSVGLHPEHRAEPV